jgi:hypothetical protein
MCGWCARVAHMEIHATPALSFPTDSDADPVMATISASYRCAHCNHISIAYMEAPRAWLDGYSPADLANHLDQQDDIQWLPLRGTAPIFEDVPDHIAAAASEAYECQSIGAHRAAVSLARSVVEATAKAKGITKGHLIEKIDKLEAERIIRPTVAAGCHEVRHLGNDMAHGDFTDPVTDEEAGEVLELMSELLHDVFQQDARVERRRAAREAKKAAQAAEAVEA